MRSKKFEILYKTYSKEVAGYILRIADFAYIVINKCLSKKEAKRAEETLKEIAESHPPSKLILLKGDGEIYKTDNLEFLERAC